MSKPPTRIPRGKPARDARPRIHIRATGDNTVSWQFGPHGRPRYSGTAGQALDEALALIDHKDAVIFWERQPIDG